MIISVITLSLWPRGPTVTSSYGYIQITAETPGCVYLCYCCPSIWSTVPSVQVSGKVTKNLKIRLPLVLYTLLWCCRNWKWNDCLQLAQNAVKFTDFNAKLHKIFYGQCITRSFWGWVLALFKLHPYPHSKISGFASDPSVNVHFSINLFY